MSCHGSRDGAIQNGASYFREYFQTANCPWFKFENVSILHRYVAQFASDMSTSKNCVDNRLNYAARNCNWEWWQAGLGSHLTSERSESGSSNIFIHIALVLVPSSHPCWNPVGLGLWHYDSIDSLWLTHLLKPVSPFADMLTDVWYYRFITTMCYINKHTQYKLL